MPRLFKEPLLHFFVFGGLLFALLSLRNGGSGEAPLIRVSAEQIERLARSQLLIDGSGLRSERIEDLVDAFVRDEVYYREALALGLDDDDDQVRTRLIEKMRYLTEDLADPEPPSDAALRAFFDANPTAFVEPASVSFDHVFFSPSQRGTNLERDVAAALERLRAGASPSELGDRTPLGSRFDAAPAERLRILFGDALTDAAFAAPLEEWIGPYVSDFGYHVLRVTARSEARQPEFEAVRELARERYAAEQRRQRNEAAYAAMRARYEVEIDWPTSAASPP